MTHTIPAETEPSQGNVFWVPPRPTSRGDRGKGVALTLSVLVLAVVAGILAVHDYFDEPSADEKAHDAARLEQVFPVFEELHLRGYRNQDWCKFIDYPKGSFSQSSHHTTCDLFDGPPKAFDAGANADFDRVTSALRDTGVDTYLVWWIEYDDSGHVKAAEFDLASPLFDRWSYVYDRDGEMPENDDGESVYTQINDDWWFWWSDWM